MIQYCEGNKTTNEELLAEISKVWDNHPSLRFGQLLSNAMNLFGQTSTKKLDLFYVTDNDLVVMLREFDKELSNQR